MKDVCHAWMRKAATLMVIFVLFAMQAVAAQELEKEIFVDKFELNLGESHHISGYDADIMLDRTGERKSIDGGSDGYWARYTIKGKNPLYAANPAFFDSLEGYDNEQQKLFPGISNGLTYNNTGKEFNYSSQLFTNFTIDDQTVDRIYFQIAAESINSTAATVIVTRDTDLIRKEQCNNEVFDASDFFTKTPACSNCPNIIGDCSADYLNGNAEFPIKIKEITVENEPARKVFSTEGGNSGESDRVYVKIKNEGSQPVTLSQAGIAVFGYNEMNNVNQYNEEFSKTTFAPGEEYSFSYQYPSGYTFFPSGCGQEVMTGLAYLHDLYQYGTYGGKAFAFNKVEVRCLSGGKEYPEKKSLSEENAGIGYPGLPEAQECGQNWQCPEGLECISFPKFGPRCAKPEPCSYFNCLKGTSCNILEGYPPSAVCACTGAECQGTEENETITILTIQAGTTHPQNYQLSTVTSDTVTARGVLKTAKAAAYFKEGLLSVENSKLYMQMTEPSQKKRVTVMPEEAISKAESSTGIVNASDVELIQESGRPVYVIKAKKAGKILSLIPVSIEIETHIDAEKGEILKVKKPWWNFLAR